MAQTRYYSQIFEDSETEILIDIYADEGVTGLLILCKFCRFCPFGSPSSFAETRHACPHVSRFARNTKDCLKDVRELKSLGITIYFEKENIDTANMADEMMITIMGSLAQEESTSISQNMQWSIRKRMANGTFIISHVPYGYMKSEGKMIVNPMEAEIVKRIYEDFLNGKGLLRISNDLNAEGIPKNSKGEPWNKNVVRYVLTNEKYIGDCLWQKKFTENVFPFRKSKNQGQVDSYYITDAHESIISREDFTKVQTLLKQRGEYFVNTEFKQYPLSMKIFCDKCGKIYRRKIVNGKIYWVCRTHDNRAKDCPNKAIAQDLIYIAFIRLYNKLWYNYKQILGPLQTTLQDLKLRKFSGRTQVMDIHKEIAKLREQTHVLARLKTKGFLDEAKYIEQTTELTAKINKLQAELKKLTRSDDEDETLDQIEMLIDFFERCNEPITEFEESAFESMVEKIVVINQHELEFHLIGGLKFKEFI